MHAKNIRCAMCRRSFTNEIEVIFLIFALLILSSVQIYMWDVSYHFYLPFWYTEVFQVTD